MVGVLLTTFSKGSLLLRELLLRQRPYLVGGGGLFSNSVLAKIYIIVIKFFICYLICRNDASRFIGSIYHKVN